MFIKIFNRQFFFRETIAVYCAHHSTNKCIVWGKYKNKPGENMQAIFMQ